MAYVNQETKKMVEPKIKAILRKYNLKGTVAVRHNMTLVVNIKSGNLDFINNYISTTGNQYAWGYMQINNYYINRHFSGIVCDCLMELYNATKIDTWRDNSDLLTDYFDISYYIDINIGKYDKPYKVIL